MFDHYFAVIYKTNAQYTHQAVGEGLAPPRKNELFFKKINPQCTHKPVGVGASTTLKNNE